MKNIIFYFLLFTLNSFSQPTPTGCNMQDSPVNTIFYPNTSSTVNPFTMNTSYMYLCGPNTLVYDTSNVILNGNQCRSAYITSTSTLVTVAPVCNYFSAYFVKNNGTLVINGSGSSGGLVVIYEPGATIVNNTGSGIITATCTVVNFPQVNCVATSIDEVKTERFLFNVFPNPTNAVINLQDISDYLQNSALEVINALGQTIFTIPYQKQINVSMLPSGFYNIKIKTLEGLIYNSKFIKE